jgi:hypothetical protein
MGLDVTGFLLNTRLFNMVSATAAAAVTTTTTWRCSPVRGFVSSNCKVSPSQDNAETAVRIRPHKPSA